MKEKHKPYNGQISWLTILAVFGLIFLYSWASYLEFK